MTPPVKSCLITAEQAREALAALEHSQLALPTWLRDSTLVATLRSFIEQAERDRVRLDFIAENARVDPKMDGQHVYWPTTFNQNLRGPNLREAIDAKMAAALASQPQSDGG